MRALAEGTRLVSGEAALDLLDDRWDELLALQAVPNPMLSARWLRALAAWRTGTPLVAVAVQDGAYVAGGAFELQHRRRLAPQLARWLGPLEQVCSVDMIAAPGRADAAWALLELVFEVADVVSVATPAGGVTATALAANAPWRSSSPFSERGLLSWPAPRLDYARKRVARDLRRARSRGAEVEVRVAAAPEEVEAALVRLFRVHRERWRDRDDVVARIATSAAHRRWNRRAVGGLAAAGGVRIAEVLEDGRVVGSALGLLHGRGGFGHTSAVRPGGALVEPGHLAVLACMEALGEAGATIVDLGTNRAANGPKTRLGAVNDPVVAILAAGSARRQHRFATTYQAVDAFRRARAAAAPASRPSHQSRPASPSVCSGS